MMQSRFMLAVVLCASLILAIFIPGGTSRAQGTPPLGPRWIPFEQWGEPAEPLDRAQPTYEADGSTGQVQAANTQLTCNSDRR